MDDVGWRQTVKIALCTHGDEKTREEVAKSFAVATGATQTSSPRDRTVIYTVPPRENCLCTVELFNLQSLDVNSAVDHLRTADCILYVYRPTESALLLHLPAMMENVPNTTPLVMCAVGIATPPVSMIRPFVYAHTTVAHRSVSLDDQEAIVKLFNRCRKTALAEMISRSGVARPASPALIDSSRSGASTSSPRSARSDKPIDDDTNKCAVS